MSGIFTLDELRRATITAPDGFVAGQVISRWMGADGITRHLYGIVIDCGTLLQMAVDGGIGEFIRRRTQPNLLDGCRYLGVLRFIPLDGYEDLIMNQETA